MTDLLPISHVRRLILHRQGLLEPFEEPLQAVRAMVAVQTQYAASLPVAVATRVKRAKPEWDDRALVPGGSLIKSWSLRHTLHAHTSEDHSLVVGSLGPHLYPNYINFMTKRRSLDCIAELETKVLAALQDRPLTRRELHERVPELKDIEGVGWGLDVMGLAFRRLLCVVGRGGEQRFCALPAQAVAPSYGQLLRRYLASYGPASKPDFAHWTGLKGPQVQAAFSELASDILPVQFEGKPGARFALHGTLESKSDEPMGVRLLAKFDPLVLAHKDKSIFIAPESRTKVFRIAGQVEAVVLIEGMAAGTWRMDRRTKKITFTIEAWRKLEKREVGRIHREAERVAKSFGLKEIEIYFT